MLDRVTERRRAALVVRSAEADRLKSRRTVGRVALPSRLLLFPVLGEDS